jgi:NAD(P)-dependent dehydrogenase (short-subunit alcohol dehydrogenase family)
VSLDLDNPLAAFRLDGEVAAITGAASGIGRAVAQAFAKVGARVAILDRDGAAAERAASEISNSAEAHAMDVTDEAAVEKTFADIVKRHGRIDVLVNAAGIAIRKPAVDFPLEEFELVNKINVTGTFLCARTAARTMLAKGDGRIVNFASIVGLSGGLVANAAYNSSKGAVVNLTRTLAVEWAAQGVRVNAVAPTFVYTPLTNALLENAKMRQMIEDATPMGRIGQPADIVGAVLYLSTRASALVTGHILAVDGGYLAR